MGNRVNMFFLLTICTFRAVMGVTKFKSVTSSIRGTFRSARRRANASNSGFYDLTDAAPAKTRGAFAFDERSVSSSWSRRACPARNPSGTESVLQSKKTELQRWADSPTESTLSGQVEIEASRVTRVMPPRDGPQLKDRFRSALLGGAAFE
jgi:hypothetical protein